MKLSRLNPFVQVFYSNGIQGDEFMAVDRGCLNPFVQVFYSNEKDSSALLVANIDGLNPFVQVITIAGSRPFPVDKES